MIVWVLSSNCERLRCYKHPDVFVRLGLCWRKKISNSTDFIGGSRMRCVFKRVAALVLACIVTVLSVDGSAFAAVDTYLPEADRVNFLNSVISRMSVLQAIYGDNIVGQYGLLYKLEILGEYAMYLKYLVKYRDDLHVYGSSNAMAGSESEAMLNYYVQDFAEKCVSFDYVYSNESSRYVSLKLGIRTNDLLKSSWDRSYSSISNVTKTLCSDTIPKYLSEIIKKISNESEGMTAGELRAKYGVLLSHVYSCMDDLLTAVDDITNVSPYIGKSVDGGRKQVDFEKVIHLQKKLQEIQREYYNLLDIGAQIAGVTGQDSVVTINSEKTYLENMADITEDSDGNIHVPEGVKTSLAYLAILSAGSTYTPFSSYVGDSVFKEALKSLVSDESAIDAVVEFYDNTKSYRKPLYKREINVSGQPSGKAELITANDFFQDVVSGNVGALVTVHGRFLYDSESNYWVYSDSYKATDSAGSTNASYTNEDYENNADDALKDQSGTDISSDLGSTDEEDLYHKSADNVPDGVFATSGAHAKCNSVARTYMRYTAVTSQSSRQYNLLNGPNAKTVNGFRVVGERYCIALGSGYTSKIGTKVDLVLEDGTILKCILGDAKADVHTDASTHKFQHFDGSVAEFIMGENYRSSSGNVNDELGTSSPIKKVVIVGNPDPDDFLDGKIAISDAWSSPFSPMRVQAAAKNENVGGPIDPDELNFQNSGLFTDRELDGDSDNSTGDPNQDDTVGNNSAGVADEVLQNESVSSMDSAASGKENVANSANTATITTSETNQVQIVDGGTKDTIVNAVMAEKIITSEDRMSEPVLLYGAKYSRTVDNMTTAILQNILSGTIGYESAASDSNDYLYMNAYGDIVTDDNLVILPGVANPIIYEEGIEYNPFTVAFMNYYPRMLQNTSFFQISSEEDIGKYMFFNSYNETGVGRNKAALITTKNNIKNTAPIAIPGIYTDFIYNTVESQKVFSYQRLIFGDAGRWLEDGTALYQYTPFIISNQLNHAGVSIFPYVSEEDANPADQVTVASVEPYAVARVIAQNMFSYLAENADGSSANQSKLSDNYLLYYFAISNLNGISNPSAFAENDAFAYDRYSDDSARRKERSALGVCSQILEAVSDSTGVIGMQNSYQSKILGPLFALLKERAAFVFVALLIVLIYSFLRVSRDAFQTLIVMIVTLGFAYGFVYVFPVYVPIIYNSVINNVAENLSYEVLGVKTEYNDTGGVEVNYVNSDGNYVMDTSSITLYRTATYDQNDLYASADIEETDVVGGNTYILNQEAGVFIEGDSLKVNSDILFDTLKIKGGIDETTLQYHLASYKTISNNVDYYVPYYLIVDAFLEKLNDLSDVYNIPRKTSKYANGKTKDNYLVYSFVNSSPFLTPGMYEVPTPLDHSVWTADELADFERRAAEVADALMNTFGDESQAADWLGISEFLYDLSDAEKKTLWANTLKDNGYYDKDFVVNVSKMDKLVTYVNYQVKKFVFSMENQIGSLSDDVMVKLISLRALVALTQYGSEWGHWMYPFALNYEEISVGDVVKCVFTDNYKVFIANGMDVAEYVLNRHGIFHLVIFTVAVIFLYLVSSAVTVLVPLMYLLIGLLVCIRFISGGDVKVPLKGYLKCSLAVALCSTALCLGVVGVHQLSGSVIGIYVLLLVLLIIVYFLFSIVSAIVLNVTDFGNTVIDAKVKNMFHSVSLPFKQTFIQNAAINKQYQHEMNHTKFEGSMARYRRDAKVDEMYDENGYDDYYTEYNRDNR